MASTQRPTEGFRREHEHLIHHLDDLRRTLDALRDGLGEREVAGLREAAWFFQVALKPHALWEERELYPLADELIRRYGKPSATMEMDHRDLVARMDAFQRELERLESGRAAAEDIDRIRILGYQIEAILLLHFRKEEDVYLDAIDRHAAADQVESLMESAREAHAH